MGFQKEIILVKFANGAVAEIEAKSMGAKVEEEDIYVEEERDVALTIQSFKAVTDVIEGFAQEIADSFKKVKPTKAIVEFGLDIVAESGKITGMFVEGSSKANLKITLVWSEQSADIVSQRK